jgi:hypothetical protein
MEKRLVLLTFGLLISGICTILFLLMMTTIAELYVKSNGRIVIGITEGGLFDTTMYLDYTFTAYVPILMFTILTLSPIMFIVCLYLRVREWKSKRSSETITLH